MSIENRAAADRRRDAPGPDPAAPLPVGSIGGLIRDLALRRRDDAAMVFGDTTRTYGDLDHRSNLVATTLLAAGVGQGDRVAYLGKNSLEFFELLFGASKIGAVMVAVNWRLAPAEIAFVLDDSTASVVVVGPGLADALASVREELAKLRLVVGLAGGADCVADVGYGDWIGSPESPSTDPGHEPGPGDVALQLYTSGTTGLPKGAMLTNRNIWNMLAPTARDWGFGPDSTTLVTLPNFHVGGVGWALVGIYAGSRCVILPEFTAVGALSTIDRERVTHVVLVPSAMATMLDRDDLDAYDASSLFVVVYGASPISDDLLIRAIGHFGCGFIQSYGLTETVGGVIQLLQGDHDPTGPNAHRLRSAGRPMDGVEVRVVEPSTGRDLPLSEVGELWLRTPRVTLGYWGRPDDTREAIDGDGWFHTGDAGHLDADGYVYISDRMKDMIISGGENVYPVEVENVLMAHEDVVDVAVVGVPSARWGETPKALVVARRDTTPDEYKLIEYCRSRLARYKCPTSVELVEALPRNPMGKVLKRELRERFWADHDRRVN